MTACGIDPARDGDCWAPSCPVHGICSRCGQKPGGFIHSEPYDHEFLLSPAWVGDSAKTHAFVRLDTAGVRRDLGLTPPPRRDR